MISYLARYVIVTLTEHLSIKLNEMILIILGLPGSGKGTQARLISNELGIACVGFSDLLRREAKTGTRVGAEIAELLDAHKLAPTEIAMTLLNDCFSDSDSDLEKGLILEGFPRNHEQALALDKVLQDRNLTIDGVFYLEISMAEAVRRLLNRAICPNEECGRIFATIDAPGAACCDQCGTVLIRRNDDLPEIAMKRCELVKTSTEWLERFYQTKFHRIDATDSAKQVTRAIVSRLRREQKD